MGLTPADLTFSRHVLTQMIMKGFTAEQVRAALTTPDKVTDVTRYPGQRRYCGSGVAVVVSGRTVVTVYADGIVTPRRADQTDAAALSSRRLARV